MDDIELKKMVDDAVNPVMEAFTAFKDANDARLAEVEKKGAADPILTEKIENIEGTLSKFENLNQQLTLAQKQAKAAQEAAERVEVAMARMPTQARDKGESLKSRFNEWVRAAVRAGSVGSFNLTTEEQKSLSDVAGEYKSLNVTTDTAGGYLAPIEYLREMLKAETEISAVRGLVTVRSTMFKAMQLPRRTGQFAAQWVAEQGTKSETTGLAYGLDEIPLHEIYALVDISNQMLEDTAFDMESELRMEATEQFAIAEGQAVLSGNGVGKPLGILSSADISSVNSGHATAITADGLLSLFYAIKTAYARNGTFGMNRSTIAAIRKLKDGEGNYLWMPGLASGVPNTINGAPYVELPDMPNIGAGTYPVLFGDWGRAYTLVDRLAMEFLRDPYTQATSGNIRFIFRRRLGGQVRLAEAMQKLYISA